MTALEQNEMDEKAKAEQIIAATPLLPEVESVSVRLDEDWSGDPSFYVTFRIRSGVVFDDDFFERFNNYTSEVETRIIHSGLKRFPYTRLKPAA